MLNWYAVHTQANAEQKAAANLRRQDFGVYLPRHMKRRRHARRTDWVPSPLFPRYLFVEMDIEKARWRAIQSTFGVSYLVCLGGGPVAVPPTIIDDIRTYENEQGVIVFKPGDRFKKGDRVQMQDGPFDDCIGLFESVTDEERVIVLLELLGRQVKVNVPAEAVHTYL